MTDRAIWTLPKDVEMVKGLGALRFYAKENVDADLWRRMKNPDVRSFTAFIIFEGDIELKHLYSTEKSALKEIAKHTFSESSVYPYRFKRTKDGWSISLSDKRHINVYYYSKAPAILNVPVKVHIVWTNNGKEMHRLNKDGTVGRRLI